jgi:hypothetical protein
MGETIQLLGAIGGIIIVLDTLFLWAVKWVLDRERSQLRTEWDVRFAAFEKQVTDTNSRCNCAERDILKLRAELPVDYVQRVDHIRMSNAIDAKLDALRELLYRLLDRKGETDGR